MATVDPLELPADHPRRAGQPALTAALDFTLPPWLTEGLRGLSTGYGTTLGATLLGGFQALLHRYTGRDDLVLEILGETLCIDVSGGPTFAELLGRADPHPCPLTLMVPGLALSFREDASALRGRVDYDCDLFEPDSIHRLRGHLIRLLAGAVTDPGQRLSQLPLLTTAEEGVLQRWNATEVDYPNDRTVPELIGRQATATPDAIALVFGGATLTYRELDERSNQVAQHLRALGVGTETRVAVYLERSFDLLIGLLGVLKAGGAYVPLDPSYPPARLAFMVSDAQAPVLLTQRDLADRLPAHGAEVVRLDADRARLAAQPIDPPARRADGSNLAYVIYTSGSTGQPKGVMNTHRGLLNRLLWMQDTYHLTAQDAVLQKTPCGFDVSVWEFFWPLLTGARLVIAKPGGHQDPHYLAELIDTEKITFVHFVPSMLQLFLEAADLGSCGSLRQVVCSGEALPVELARRFFASGLRTALDNLYGPTEAAIDVTHWACRAGDSRVPIGRPIANTTTHVLDKYGNRVPIGVPGELHLGGVQLARGYLNRPDLTEERFIPDPFSPIPSARLYTTGDLARWRPDGALEYLGRRDHQIKLRGFRIELGEIEAAVLDHDNVAEAVVQLREDAVGEPMLAACLVYRKEPTPVDELHAQLSDRLPAYMVPGVFLSLDAIPLSPNGKVDRAALLALPLLESAGTGTYLPPRTDVEQRLAVIWAGALGLDRVGVQSDFFALGGHSLRAVQVLDRIRREFGIAAPLSSLFQAPTIARFGAEEVEPRLLTSHEEPITRASSHPLPELRRRDATEAPLSFAQRRLWFLHQLFPEIHAYHLPMAYELHGPLDLTALRDALTEVVRRHQVLRSGIVTSPAGVPVQVIGTAEPIPLPVTEVAEVSEDLLRERTAVPFDLRRGPLLRAEVFRIAEHHHVLLLIVHHLASDEWTLGVLAEELSTGYSALTRGVPSQPAELALQYADYARWQQDALTAETLNRQLEYWTKQLAGLNPVVLPTDRPRPPVQSFVGRRENTWVPAELMDRLRALGRAQGGTDFMIMTAGLQTLLRRYTGQDDIAVGVVTSDRAQSGLERLAGFFVNTVVLRTDLSGDPSFADVLSRVRDTALQAYDHQDLPFERLVEAVAPERDVSQTPLFGIAVSYLNTPEVDLRLAGVAAREFPFDAGIVRFDLDLFMRDRDGGIAVDVDYRTDLFDATTVRRLLDHYLRLLTTAADHPNIPISRLELSSAEEQRELVEFGSSPVAHPERPLIHQLVADWARRQPDAPAVQDGRRTLSYGDLDDMADRLAHQLRACGAGRDVLVAVLLERSAEFVVALLAVLKAGAAYLPLDPSYPDERLADLLADSQAPIVLTTTPLAARLADPPGRLLRLEQDIDLDRDADLNSARPAEQLPVEPGDLAYVIYTSGSTGHPKGVLIEHRGLLNLCHWHVREYHVTPEDRGTLIAAQGFDASVWELWPYLAAGASVSVADETTRSDPTRLARWLIEQHATLTFLATPLAEAIMDGELVDALPVRAILTGGDQLRRRPRPDLPFVLVNHYGPTECTVVATAGPVVDSATAQDLAPIGQPIDNVEVYLLDEHRALVPRGVTGELYLGGVQVARGYLNQPELTEEHFVASTLGPPGSRLYRTGDLARRRTDGQLEFLGRADRQIKIRGHRIEPGEVEIRLREHPTVAETVVTAQITGTGDRSLVGYLTAAPGLLPEPGELRQWLRDKLPDYMVPTRFVVLPEFPMTSSGKIDRHRLPAPSDDEPNSRERSFVAPRDDVERAVADLFGTILGRDQVGIHDSFFDLGGHSLLAAQLTAGLRRDFGIELPMRAIFAGPTVEGLAIALVEAALATAEDQLEGIGVEGAIRW